MIESHKKQTYLVAIILLAFASIMLFLLNSPTGLTGLAVLEEEIAFDQALDNLLIAEQDLKELGSYGISTFFIEDTLLDAKKFFIGKDTLIIKAKLELEENPIKSKFLTDLILKTFKELPKHELEERDYAEVIRLTQIISGTKTQAYNLFDRLELLNEKKEMYSGKNMDVSEEENMLIQAITAFEEERYSEVESKLFEIENSLENSLLNFETSEGLEDLQKNFFQRNAKTLILITLFFIIFIPIIAKKMRINLAKRKLRDFKIELKTTKELIKKAQESCFKDKKISIESYKVKADKYNARISELKQQIPVLANIVMNTKSKKSKLKK